MSLLNGEELDFIANFYFETKDIIKFLDDFKDVFSLRIIKNRSKQFESRELKSKCRLFMPFNRNKKSNK